MQSDADTDKIFSTGLQDKDGRKRGLTDRLRNTIQRGSGKSNRTTNKRSSRQDPTSTSQNRTSDTNHRKYMEGSNSSNTSPEPAPLAERSANAPRSTGYRIRWATWLYRLVGLLLLLSIASILVVGFTPASVPDGVPPQVAEPIEGAGAASSAFVANLTDTSPQTGTVQNGSTQTISQTSNTDGSTSTVTAEPDTAAPIDVARVEKLVHQKVNAERQSRGLSTLSFDSGLQELARYHSGDMAKNDYFAHTAPDGETMGDRYDTFNYQCRVSVGDNRYVTGAENIFSMSFSGVHYSEEEIATETVEGWMNSPGHRENILKDYWKNEGIGVYIEEENGETKVYVTQNFC